MSTMFSCEEKRRVLLYVVDNSLDGNLADDDEKWIELGRQMDRDWKVIREAYRQWKVEDDQPDVKKIENDEHEHFDILDLTEADGVGGELEVRNAEDDQYPDELQYADLNGQLYDLQQYEQYLINNPQIVDNLNYNHQRVIPAGGKRALDLSEFNEQVLQTFEEQSTEELNLKREEHEKKMQIYNMHLEQGREIHNERMKLLKAKLRKLQDEVHHIDHVICNRSLRRKFKSGPI